MRLESPITHMKILKESIKNHNINQLFHIFNLPFSQEHHVIFYSISVAMKGATVCFIQPSYICARKLSIKTELNYHILFEPWVATCTTFGAPI
jgi:hypothetical protein